MRVGTSFRCNGFQIVNQDHPHACGDKMFIRNMTEISPGSSPCVWGQDKSEVSKLNEARIIPMRVGTSCWWEVLANVGKDHPHACGDKTPLNSLLIVVI